MASLAKDLIMKLQCLYRETFMTFSYNSTSHVHLLDYQIPNICNYLLLIAVEEIKVFHKLCDVN